jgi:hypothetical protein
MEFNMVTTSDEADAPRTLERNLRDTGQGLVIWSMFSILLILLYALAFWSAGFERMISIFTHGSLISVAFGSIGSLMGFLFGIPKTLQSASALNATSQSASQSGQINGGADDYHQSVNTNLEQISDWLTKILVGVGLTQLQNMPQKLMGLAAYFQSGLGGNAPLTLVIILNSMVLGFFAGYLLTRLFLAGAFVSADRFASADLARKEQFAQGLTEAGAYHKAISTLEAALAEIGPRTSIDVKRDIYEGLLYNYLYVEPPEGFQKAIQYGRTYNEQEPATPSTKIWAYLAAAYGQQYKWEQDHGKNKDVLDSARKNALDAIDRSLKLEPKMKSLLRSMWDPTDPTKERSQEDDLEVFYTDTDFQKLLA